MYKQTMGAPHLARFSRDVGYDGSLLLTLTDVCSSQSEPWGFAESHISRKTSEMWGTHRLLHEGQLSLRLLCKNRIERSTRDGTAHVGEPR